MEKRTSIDLSKVIVLLKSEMVHSDRDYNLQKIKEILIQSREGLSDSIPQSMSAPKLSPS